jgi:hypothetical protein
LIKDVPPVGFWKIPPILFLDIGIKMENPFLIFSVFTTQNVPEALIWNKEDKKI